MHFMDFSRMSTNSSEENLNRIFCTKSRLLLETFVFEQKIEKKVRIWDFIQKNRADPPPKSASLFFHSNPKSNFSSCAWYVHILLFFFTTLRKVPEVCILSRLWIRLLLVEKSWYLSKMARNFGAQSGGRQVEFEID